MLYLYECLYVLEVMIISGVYKDEEEVISEYYKIQALILTCGGDEISIIKNIQSLTGISVNRFWETFYMLMFPIIFLN